MSLGSFKKLGVLIAAGAASTALAHHSVFGVFDPQAPFSVTGVVSEVEWINPHVFLHVDVADESLTEGPSADEKEENRNQGSAGRWLLHDQKVPLRFDRSTRRTRCMPVPLCLAFRAEKRAPRAPFR